MMLFRARYELPKTTPADLLGMAFLADQIVPTAQQAHSATRNSRRRYHKLVRPFAPCLMHLVQTAGHAVRPASSLMRLFYLLASDRASTICNHFHGFEGSNSKQAHSGPIAAP
jgi:hypothetical protein